MIRDTGEMGSIPRLGRSQREGNSSLLSQFLGRLISPKEERGVWNSQAGGKDKLFFSTFLSLSND